MANSMLLTGACTLCLIVGISGFHNKQTAYERELEKKLAEATAKETKQKAEDLNKQIEANIQKEKAMDKELKAKLTQTQQPAEVINGDADVHLDATVVPREERFGKNGKKLKQKQKGKGKWKPKNVVTAPAVAEETPAEKEKRLFEEFAATSKQRTDNRVVLDKELEGLDGFVDKVDKARDWQVINGMLKNLGEVGKETLRKNPDLQDQLMNEDKSTRLEAAKSFLEKADKVKDSVLDEKMRMHAEFMRRAPSDMWDTFADHNQEKARRLMEYDETVKRRQMRGKARRPLGEGEDLPTPDDL